MSCVPALTRDMGELEEFRRLKDEFFRSDPRAPLRPDQRERFVGLGYYPVAPELRIEAPLETEGVDTHGEIRMQTTSGAEQVYRRAGRVRFTVDGEPASITLFSSPEKPELFVPFRDQTSGKETYGAGRYLEVDPPGVDRVVVMDLNYAYNPYCCYDDAWSCPLPPTENWLPVPIRAGERDFPG